MIRMMTTMWMAMTTTITTIINIQKHSQNNKLLVAPGKLCESMGPLRSEDLEIIASSKVECIYYQDKYSGGIL